MIKSQKSDMYLVPVAFDHMLFSLSENPRSSARFETEKHLGKDYLDRLCSEIEALKSPVCLDMKYISSYASRAFTIFEEKKLPLIIVGTDNRNVSLVDGLQQDMKGLVLHRSKGILYTDSPEVEALVSALNFSNKLNELYKEKNCELLRSVAIKVRDIPAVPQDAPGILLESSGVYVNRYIALKNLFLNIDNALFIIYQMAEKVQARYPDRKGLRLICCSKTGAVFASILSMLLGIPPTYCVNIGPKFALISTNLREEIQPGVDYVFVFDFMCMGTEAKILHALVSAFGANLAYGIGVSNYLNFSEPQFTDGFLSKLETLVDIQSAILDYTITPIVKKQEAK